MKAIQLLDKFTRETVGTVLVTEKLTERRLQQMWDEFQSYYSSSGRIFGSIEDFTNYFSQYEIAIVDVVEYMPMQNYDY